MIRNQLRNLIVSGYGYKIKRKNNLFVISSAEETYYFSPKEVEQLIIAGDVLITSAAIRHLLEYGVDIVFVNQRSRFFARVMRTDENKTMFLWQKQLELSDERRMQIAREIVDSAIYNKIRFLQQLARNRDIDLTDTIQALRVQRGQIKTVVSPMVLMGVEGYAAKIYFHCLSRVIPGSFHFLRRRKHPAVDPVNAMFDYGYAVLLSKVTHALLLAGLNVYLGVLHETYRDRMALAFDLMEEFRQPIIDRVIITLLARNMIHEEDFKQENGMCRMTPRMKKMYLEALYTRFEQPYTYRNTMIEFQDIIVHQAKALAFSIVNDCPYRGFRYR